MMYEKADDDWAAGSKARVCGAQSRELVFGQRVDDGIVGREFERVSGFGFFGV